MSRNQTLKKTSLQLVNFNSGLITEANPLLQPLGSTRDEQNFTLETNGVRKRRLGIGYENGASEIPISVVDTDLVDAGVNTFRWDLTGEVDGKFLIVVQLGNVLKFFNSTEEALSSNLEGSITLGTDPTDVSYSITQVNSLLVVATSESIRTVEYVEAPIVGDLPSFTVEELTLEVRDFFGVEDYDPTLGAFIDKGNTLNYRPPSTGDLENSSGDTTAEHIYNLYNQGWPTEKSWTYHGTGSQIKYRRVAFLYCRLFNSFFPSNADTYPEYVVSVADKVPREAEAFVPETMEAGEIRTYAAAKGRAIIELLSRGKGRQEVYNKSDSDVLGLWPWVANTDSTPKSASSVAEFAGRVFYAGFSGKVFDGDDKSPRLNNCVAFSQLVTQKKQASQCYQEADPTSASDSEVVATDGGLIRISGATNIVGLVAVSNSLLVFAENGVWQIIGGNDFGFSAENYQVVKVTERGCISPRSIVNLGEQVMYWSTDGIYLTQSTEGGFFTAQDVTATTIKTLYEGISTKTTSVGTYDNFDKTVRWVYGDGEELLFREDFGAWIPNKIDSTNIKLRGLVEVSPFVGGRVTDEITVGGVDVTVGIEQVVITTGVKISKRTEVKYLTIRPDNNTFTFSSYNDTDFIDWGGVSEGFESDAYAYLQGAHFTGGAGNREKQSPYVTFHFNKTEDGFDENFNPTNQSSCLVQTSWDWSNSTTSGKQGREFQAYRFRRHYIPENNLGDFDNGYETVVTKNKVRGRGKALSVRINSEPLKDCQLIGWEQEITVNSM